MVAAGVLGAGALTLFVRRQLRLPTPLIDVRLFGNRAFSGVVAANLLSVLGLSGLVFFLSQFFQLVHGYGPLKAGLAELPAAVTATVFGVLAGVAVRYWSSRAVLTAGLALVGVAMASLTFLTPSTPYLPLGIALFLVGVGLGLAFTVASDVILASVDKERAGAAAAVSETAYELGMALGIAILGSIVTGRVPRLRCSRRPSARGGVACPRLAVGGDTRGGNAAGRPERGTADRGEGGVHQRPGDRLGCRIGADADLRGGGLDPVARPATRRVRGRRAERPRCAWRYRRRRPR